MIKIFGWWIIPFEFSRQNNFPSLSKNFPEIEFTHSHTHTQDFCYSYTCTRYLKRLFTEIKSKKRGKGAENTQKKTFKLRISEPYFRIRTKLNWKQKNSSSRAKGELELLFIVCLFYILFKNDLGFPHSSLQLASVHFVIIKTISTPPTPAILWHTGKTLSTENSTCTRFEWISSWGFQFDDSPDALKSI